MNRTFSFFLFFLILASNILSSESGWLLGVYITKPLLIPSLAWMLAGSEWRLVRWVWMALFFSWIGDILLMLPYDLFIFGLGSFLVAHIFYIRHFIGIWRSNGRPINRVVALVLIGYLLALFSVLFPVLGDLRIPVVGYGIVISTMLLFASQTASIGYAIGATFFVLSDTLLAINKFYTPLPMAALLVMSTYGLAQYYIVKTARTIKFE